MKYIRTKNAVYEVIKNELGECIKIDGGFVMLDDIKDKIIKEADTIEELCDVMVYECKRYYNIYQKYEIGNVDSLQYNRENDLLSNVYGAIWTDKGLIFVAKMVDGKLVLI